MISINRVKDRKNCNKLGCRDERKTGSTSRNLAVSKDDQRLITEISLGCLISVIARFLCQKAGWVSGGDVIESVLLIHERITNNHNSDMWCFHPVIIAVRLVLTSFLLLFGNGSTLELFPKTVSLVSCCIMPLLLSWLDIG